LSARQAAPRVLRERRHALRTARRGAGDEADQQHGAVPERARGRRGARRDPQARPRSGEGARGALERLGRQLRAAPPRREGDAAEQVSGEGLLGRVRAEGHQLRPRARENRPHRPHRPEERQGGAREGRRRRAHGRIFPGDCEADLMTANPLDLRPWLAEVETLGELKHVRGADWNLELGAISELNVKKDLPPALLFDEIKGYPKGFRVLTCSTSSPARLSSILRLPIQKTHKGLVEALRGKPAQWQAAAAEFPAVTVKTGPALEHVDREVDVLKFPSPLWHEHDGGRYIGTGCSVVTRDLDSDWINVGTYRVQALDRNH